MKVAILISGRGSNMQNIVQHFKGSNQLQISCVLSNKANAEGLIWAQNQGLKTHVIDPKKHPTREAFDQAMIDVLDPLDVDYIILAGFMRILTSDFVKHFAGRILNIHPSILPSFTGLHTHQRALNEGVKIHGATVHFVVPELDAGPIIAQAGLPVLHQNPADLAADVLVLEHYIYPKVIEWLLHDELCVQVQSEHTALGVAQYPIAELQNLLKNITEDNPMPAMQIIHRANQAQFFNHSDCKK
jgi:phosphoribosylglycinamide formyltransferase 1